MGLLLTGEERDELRNRAWREWHEFAPERKRVCVGCCVLLLPVGAVGRFARHGACVLVGVGECECVSTERIVRPSVARERPRAEDGSEST